MPDAHSPQTPRSWSGAFAALPQDTPGADGWERLAARLPSDAAIHAQGRGPRRVARWLALAAVLAIAVVVPWRWMRDASPRTAGADASRVAMHGPAAAQPQVADAASEQRPIGDSAVGARHPAASAVEVATATSHGETASAPEMVSAPATRGVAARDPTPRPVASSRRDASRVRSGHPHRGAAASPDASSVATAAAETRVAAESLTSLDALYAESARLEALLALARDDRVASGTAAALSGELDAQVAGIDAALTQTDLPDEARAALWRQRIDALRQAAGFESTRRMLAAQGERYDAMLVSID